VEKTLQSYSDEHLLMLMTRNDEPAFSVLYDRYWKKLLVQALVRTGRPEEAEEVVQTVFINLWRRRQTLQVRCALSTYLAAMLKYEIIALFARQRKESMLKQRLVSLQLAEDNGTMEWLEYEQLLEDIEKTVAALPEKCRLVFRLSREQGLSGKQIATSLDISPKTVEAHMNRALKALNASLRQLTSFF
jgi:RNA polymerase sigma-70 factor (ECF subfamily)